MPEPARLLVVQHSLAAEGVPVLTLRLVKALEAFGISSRVLTLFDSPSDLRPAYEAAKVDVRTARLPRDGRRFGALLSAAHREARAFGADAVLAMTYGWHTFLAAGAKAAGARRVVAHVGNYPPHWDERNFRKFRWMLWAGQGFTDAFACCSAYVADGVRTHFALQRDNTTVVYNGVPVNEIQRRASAARTKRDPRPTVGMVARLDDTKDHETLLRAFAAVKQQRGDARLLLVGDGTARPRLERLARSLGISDSVDFTGNRTDVPELLGQMDVFAFAVRRGEGLGVALTEALAAGTPVVAADVPGCREVLGEPACGLLYEEGDAAALAAQLLLALKSDQSALVQGGRRRAESMFSLENMASGYARLLFPGLTGAQ